MVGLIKPRLKDILGLPVRRLLPSVSQRTVGPFIFLDHMGPVSLGDGNASVNIPPHPHVGLSTVTFLLPGSLPLIHRDSLGTRQAIRPGALNVMAAGRGIVHSERRPKAGEEGFGESSLMHGLQLWTAHPREMEEADPSFAHYAAEALPQQELSTESGNEDATVNLVMGSLGTELGIAPSPVRTLVPTLLATISLKPGARLPIDVTELTKDGFEEVAVYSIDGAVHLRGADSPGWNLELPPFHLSSVLPASPVLLSSAGPASSSPINVALIGGAKLDGPRFIWWNFVSSSKHRIEEAKRDWAAFTDSVERGNEPRDGSRFLPIPDDREEFVPLPR